MPTCAAQSEPRSRLFYHKQILLACRENIKLTKKVFACLKEKINTL